MKNKKDKLPQQRQGKDKKKINPFEVHINPCKHKILGQKSKDDYGLPGVSRGKAFRKREKTLLPEYRDRYKEGKFMDLRIGEKNRFLDPEKKILMRIAAEKTRQFSKKSFFKLNDDAQLTHGGKPLNEDTMKDQIVFSDDDDDNDMLDASFVKDRHFGGGIFTKVDEAAPWTTNNSRDRNSGSKTRKEWIDEMIAESKQKKADTKREKEIQYESVSKLDAKFQNFLSLMKGRAMTDEDKDKSKKTCDFRDYDMAVRELAFDRSKRANPSDRLKTEEELAKEKREKLQKLEEDRQRRMKGETDDVRHDFRISADALDDGYGIFALNKTQPVKLKEPKPIQVDLERKTKGDEASKKENLKSKKKSLEEVAEGSGEEEEDLSEEENVEPSTSEEEEEEEDSLNKVEEQSSAEEDEESVPQVYEDEPGIVEEEEDDVEVSEDELEIAEEEDVEISEDELEIAEEEDDGEVSADEPQIAEEEEDEAEIAEEEEDEAEIAEDEEDVLEISEEKESDESEDFESKLTGEEGSEENDESEEENDSCPESDRLSEDGEDERSKTKQQQSKTTKKSPMSKKEFTQNNESDPKQNSIENSRTSPETEEEELPFTFEVPVDYDEFWNVLQKRTPSQISTVIERMIACNHPSLGSVNDVKANTIFAYLLQTLHVICGVDAEIVHKDVHSLEYINPLIPHLYVLTDLSPLNCARSVTQVIDEKYDDYKMEKIRKYPYADTFIFLKISGLLFPSSDYHHDVMTRVIIFITQLLGEAKVRNGREVAALLFTSSLLFEYLNRSSRFIGELMNALNGILYLSIANDASKLSLSITPPFKRIGPSSELLVLDQPCEKPSSFQLKFSLLNKDDLEISDNFKVSILNETLKLLDKLCHKWVDSPAVRTIFLPTAKLLERIVKKNYPEQTNTLIDTLQMSISQLPKQLPYLKKGEIQVKTLRMLTPASEEIVEGAKKRVGNKDFQERQKLVHKVNRERKGARRELKRDAQFLARQQLTEVLASDAERKRKVNIIMQGLATQESEYQKFKKMKSKK